MKSNGLQNEDDDGFSTTKKRHDEQTVGNQDFFQWYNKTSPYTFQHRGADLPSIFFFYYEERGLKKEGILRENGKSSKSHLVHCHVASAPSLRAFFFRKFHKLPFSSIPILLLMETLDKILTMNMTFGTKEVSEYKRLFCLCLLLPINENDDENETRNWL